MKRESPRVALVSIGIGRVQRGFEKYFEDLFHVLRGELDITLFRSGQSAGPGQRVPPMLRTATRLTGSWPLRALVNRESYHSDCLAYAATMLPDLLRDRFDVVHFIDPPLAVIFDRLRKLVPFHPRLLFTDGCVVPPRYYWLADHVHQVSQVHRDRVITQGIPEARVTLALVGLHASRFRPQSTREELRRKHGVAATTFVALAVSAVKRTHKRIDHVIDEVSRIEGDLLLWIDGNPEDPAVVELARERLGARCRITHVATSQLPELYALSDVFIHAALEEAFGLAIVEAQASGLMVLVHDCPHFAWLTQDRECLVDMSAKGKLEARLRDMIPRSGDYAGKAETRRAVVRERFDWQTVKTDYVEMYRAVAALDRSAALAQVEMRYG